jgi:hypothetical protein
MNLQQKEYQSFMRVVDLPIPEDGIYLAGMNQLNVSSPTDPSIHLPRIY